MSEKTAKTSNITSRRSKAGQDRKPVFKSVLANPFHVQWPTVPADVQKGLLIQLIAALNGVAEYHLGRERRSRKRKANKQSDPDGKKKKSNILPSQQAPEVGDSSSMAMDTHDDDIQQDPDEEMVVDAPSVPVPPILEHVTVGINEVTKKLEAHAKTFRSIVSTSNLSGETQKPKDAIKAIFVCRADIDPPALINHLPQLVAACNSLNHGPDTDDIPKNDILLVPLGPGAESALATAVGFRRVSIIAIHNTFPHSAELRTLLDPISVLKASWLRPGLAASSRPELEPTHIKQLRTSAPKDMRATKEERRQARTAAKEREKIRMAAAREKISIRGDPVTDDTQGPRVLFTF